MSSELGLDNCQQCSIDNRLLGDSMSDRQVSHLCVSEWGSVSTQEKAWLWQLFLALKIGFGDEKELLTT